MCGPPRAAAGWLVLRAELGVCPGGDRVTAWQAAPGMAEGGPGPRPHSGGAQRGASARQGPTAKSAKLGAGGVARRARTLLGPYPRDFYPPLAQNTEHHAHKLHS